jgi:mannose-6-phosphate isomerase class I
VAVKYGRVEIVEMLLGKKAIAGVRSMANVSSLDICNAKITSLSQKIQQSHNSVRKVIKDMITLKGMKQDHLPEFTALTDKLTSIEEQHHHLAEERVCFLLIENMLERA